MDYNCILHNNPNLLIFTLNTESLIFITAVFIGLKLFFIRIAVVAGSVCNTGFEGLSGDFMLCPFCNSCYIKYCYL